VTNTSVGVCDFVKNVMEGKEMDEGEKCDFMIVSVGNPNKGKFNYVAIVICVQLQDVKTRDVTRVMPD